MFPHFFLSVQVLSTNEGIMSESLCGKGNELSSTSQPFMTMNEHCFINPPSDQKVTLLRQMSKQFFDMIYHLNSFHCNFVSNKFSIYKFCHYSNKKVLNVLRMNAKSFTFKIYRRKETIPTPFHFVENMVCVH